MKRFWDTVIEPMLEATRPKSIVEVGSDKGETTRRLLGFCEANDAVLHVVDPVPKYDVSEWQERYGERLVFHRTLSLEAIPQIEGFDLVLLDGDHNWYTVYNELKAIEERCDELSRDFPLVVLHDIFWPYARRDLYYDPETIPEAYRKAYSLDGIRPGMKELSKDGGLNRQIPKAVEEGGPRNGVLTGIEDFLAETEQRLRFAKIPGFHGLGIIVPPQLEENAGFVNVLKTWELPPAVASHVERIEMAWLENEIQRREVMARLNDLKARQRPETEQGTAKLRRANAKLRRQRDGLRRQLDGIKGSRAWQVLTVLHKIRTRVFG